MEWKTQSGEQRVETDLLCDAAMEDDPDKIRRMLDQGTPIESRNAYGMTALHMAAKHGASNAMRALLEFGANVNAENIIGITPMDLARKSNNACEQLLIQRNANSGRNQERSK